MEENRIPPIRQPLIVARWIALLIWVLCLLPLRAQTTNLLNLCTEGALQSAVGIGGIYQFGDCGSNTLPTIKLTEPLVIQHDLSLMATQEVLLDGQNLTRLIVVKPGVHFTLRNIFLFSGRHTETNFNDGGIPDTAGAGIYNDGGFVTILDGQFQQNNVVGVTGLAGGAGHDGEDGGAAAGGAIYNSGGQILISNVVFIGNSVTAGPGGVGGSGGGNFSENGGDGGNGGSAAGAAIYSKGGSVTIYASTFTTNSAAGAAAGAGGAPSGFLGFPGTPGDAGDGVGAGISGDGAEITIYGCTFFGNDSAGANGLSGNAGLSDNHGDPGRHGGDAAAGAVFCAGRVSITNSTFFANTVNSGNGGAGGAGGTGLFGGSGGNGGSGGSATGAAVEVASGQTVIVNCTFSDNVPAAGTGGVGGQGSGVGHAGKAGDTGFTSGGSIYGRGGDVSIVNNILANSKVTVGGTVTDRGGNLSTDLNPLLVNNTSMRLQNPLLSSLANNGGPTQTMAIATNSPAIDHGIAEFCPQFDQRWSNRVASCDIGAYEVTTNQSLPPIATNVLNGLTIAQSTNLVTLSWPTGYTNLYLQFATNLLSTNTAWTLAPQIPTTSSGSNSVSISTANTTKRRLFFRLFYGLTNTTASRNSGPPTP